MPNEPIRLTSMSSETDPKAKGGSESERISMDLLAGVRVVLEARLGEASMTVEDLMALKSGAIVTLETGLADHVDLYLNEVLVARGEIVAVDGKFGVRVAELSSRP